MDKIKNFIKDNYILCISILVVFIIILATIVTISLINKFKNKKVFSEDNSSYYQFFLEEKKEFSGKISYDNSSIVDYDFDDYKVMDDKIIYDSQNKKVIFPMEMGLVLYYQDNQTYFLKKFSQIEFKYDDVNVLYINEQTKYLDNYFLYDGKGLFFFVNDTILNIDDNIIDLGKGSFVYVGSEYMSYYNYLDDSIKVIDNFKNVNITSGDVVIDAINNIVKNGNSSEPLIKDINIYEEMK